MSRTRKTRDRGRVCLRKLNGQPKQSYTPDEEAAVAGWAEIAEEEEAMRQRALAADREPDDLAARVRRHLAAAGVHLD